MKTRLRLIIEVMVELIGLVILSAIALQTAWVLMNLFFHLIDVVLGLNPTRHKLDLYNSSSWYIRFLAKMTNDFIRIPFSLLVMASPFKYFKAIRQYNVSLCKSMKREARN